MSNPDASAGPYASNEKKPIGGNIMAHASTTRHVIPSLLYSQLTLSIDCSSRNHAATRVRVRSMTHLVCQRWKRTSPFSPAALETLKRRSRLFRVVPIDSLMHL